MRMFPEDNKPSSGELAHHGVKGMKWGVRKAVSDKMAARAETKAALNKPNPGYDRGMRQRDRTTYGNRGVKRINRRMNKGQDLKTARKNEVKFRKNTRRAAKAGVVAYKYRNYKEIGATLALAGGMALQLVAQRAETKRGQAAAAEAMGLPLRPTDGPTYSKKNRQGVYNISSM